MKFRLTYSGPLQATQRDPERDQKDKMAVHKHQIRRHFHHQLKQLWSANKFLREHKVYPQDYAPSLPIAEAGIARCGDDPNKRILLKDALLLSKQNEEFGFRWLPLVWGKFSLLCSLDILFLRRDIPGSAIEAGDIDNRIKTLIDALRRPNKSNELLDPEHNTITPTPDENPFYCLLEDDKQVSKLVLETDTLLDPETPEDADKRKVRLVVTVELRPYDVGLFNLSFA